MDKAKLEIAYRSLSGIRRPVGALVVHTWELLIQNLEVFEDEGPGRLRHAALTAINTVITDFSTLLLPPANRVPEPSREILSDLLAGLPEDGRLLVDRFSEGGIQPDELAHARAYLALCSGQFRLIVAHTESNPLPEPFETMGEDVNHLAAFIRDTKFLFDD